MIIGCIIHRVFYLITSPRKIKDCPSLLAQMSALARKVIKTSCLNLFCSSEVLEAILGVHGHNLNFLKSVCTKLVVEHGIYYDIYLMFFRDATCTQKLFLCP